MPHRSKRPRRPRKEGSIFVSRKKELCCPCDEMKRILRASYDGFIAGNINQILRNWSPNAFFYLDGPGLVQWGGVHVGNAAIRRAFRQMNAVFDVIRFDAFMFCIGPVVVSIGSYTFRCRQSGRQFSSWFLHFILFTPDCKLAAALCLYDSRYLVNNCPRAAGPI